MKLSDIGVRAQRFTVDGLDYIVTTGTGEVSFGRSGGEAGSAYDADEVEALTAVSSYQAFCDAVDADTDRDLAIALAARREIRLVIPGECNPVLSDAEYALVRAAVEAVQS
jgi:hypothetical protein